VSTLYLEAVVVEVEFGDVCQVGDFEWEEEEHHVWEEQLVYVLGNLYNVDYIYIYIVYIVYINNLYCIEDQLVTVYI